MAFEITLHELSEKYDIDEKSLLYRLAKNGYVPEKRGKKNIYGSEVIEYLNNFFTVLNPVEIIQVPVYVNVYWEIIHSKLNYLPNELL